MLICKFLSNEKEEYGKRNGSILSAFDVLPNGGNMEKINKSDLTALLAAISVSSGVLVSAGQPVMAADNKNGMNIAEKTNLADAEKKDEGKSEAKPEGKKEESGKKKGKGKNRGGCNYPCGCHYGVNSKKHGKGGAKGTEKKEEKPAEDANKGADKK